MQLKLYEFKPSNYAGDKPDVVLIHGTGGNASLWHTQVDLLTDRGYRCLVPELRGHGATPEPRDPAELKVHVQDLLQTLEAAEVRYPAVFVGHSLGAAISLTLAEQKPELFTQILAVSMPGRVLPAVANLFALFLRTPYHRLRHTWLYKLLPRRYQILLLTESYSMEQIVSTYRQIDFSAKQLNLQCPVHFCAGGRDVVAIASHVMQIHKSLPNSTFKLFAHSGHCCMDDQPDEFNAWLIEKISA
jgi:pimeloyl-ACP methyl ester carboxylesterase